MKRKLLLAGAVLIVLLAIIVPLAYTGKLAKPADSQQTLSPSSAQTASGKSEAASGSSAAASSANNSGSGSQSQSVGETAASNNRAQANGTVTQGAQNGTQPGGEPGNTGSQSSASGQMQGGGQAAGSESVKNGSSSTASSKTGGSGSSDAGQTITPPSPPAPQPAVAVKVEITIIGKNDETIFGPSIVSVQKDSKWGETVMGALHATGTPYRMHDKYANFVVSVAGQVNEGMHGWSYKVNGTLGAVAASDKQVAAGDKILWWYSK